jgi:membrane protein
MNKKELYKIFKTSFYAWLKDNATLRAAALTFFIILPLPTLLLIVTAIFSQFYGPTQAINLLVQQISSFAGPAIANLFSELVTNTGSPFGSVWTTIVVVGFSFVGAIGAFSVLRDTINCIWEVKLPNKIPFWKMIRQKIVPFILLSASGLIVIVWSAIAGSLLSLIRFFSINDALTAFALAVAQVVLSFTVSAILLALIYKLIPEAKVHWRDISLSVVVIGIAFTVTNYVFGTYINVFTITTVVGAAGSLLIILLWIFILNEMVLFGAEVSKIYAETIGSHSKEHLPSSLDKIVDPIEKVGRKIEQATKDEYETDLKEEESKD